MVSGAKGGINIWHWRNLQRRMKGYFEGLPNDVLNNPLVLEKAKNPKKQLRYYSSVP